MKTFVRRIGRVFLITGIAGLLTLIGGATTLLGHSSIAYANTCPKGYHLQPHKGRCAPDAAFYCNVPGPNKGFSTLFNRCLTRSQNTCPPGEKPNPDHILLCIPDSSPCGSASTYDSSRNVCVITTTPQLISP